MASQIRKARFGVLLKASGSAVKVPGRCRINAAFRLNSERRIYAAAGHRGRRF
jgi:hypothetical protein